MIRIYVCSLLMLIGLINITAQTDSTVFTPQQLLWYIEQYHPVSIQSKLLVQQGEGRLLMARGNFDPYLSAGLEQKQFNDKEYYSLLGAGLKVPTWYGIELKSGYDHNRGYQLNPQNVLPDDGLWYAGISVPIGKGLVIDKRRAELQKAKLFVSSTKAERDNMMLALFFNAIKEYWNWVAAFNEYQIHSESVELAKFRLRAIKDSYEFGDRSAVDTLEAYITVQNRELNKTQAKLKYDNVTLELSNYLWFENGMPLVISDKLQPPQCQKLNPEAVISADSLNHLIGNLAFTHPEMQMMDYQLAGLEVDRKLSFENFKPNLNFNYNFLNEPQGTSFSTNNYKWGFNFSMPLFLRSERGEYRLSKLKIQDAQWSLNQKLLDLENNLRKHYNTQVTLSKQVELYQDAVQNYNKMLIAEKMRFESGESSLFIVNARESSLIEAQLKLVVLLSDYNVSKVGVGFAAGLSVFVDE